PGLCRWLDGKGHRALHAFDVGLADAPDVVTWQRAIELGAALITKDEDFIALRDRLPAGPAVVWIRLGNATNRTLIPWFEARFSAIERALAS
ncbi:DUF5615 family PIN-like protein, partial [Vibrio parahaemolyticus]